LIALVGWLNPAILLGAAAAALPLIIHLIHRRRAPSQPFPAIELLYRTRHHMSAALHLKHWVLMFIRMVLILLIACAFARPFLSSPERLALASPDTPPAAYVFILDDSLSMKLKPDGKQAIFDRALGIIEEGLDAVRDFDRAALLSFTGSADWELPTLSSGSGAVREKIRKAGAGFRAATAWDSINRASGILAGTPMKQKMIVVFSDMAKTSWPPLESENLEDIGKEQIRIQIVHCHQRRRGEWNGRNSAVTLVSPSETAAFLTLSIAFRRFGAGAASEKTCVIEGAGLPTVTRKVKVDAQSTNLSETLMVAGRDRWVEGQVTLSEDELSADDKWFFAHVRSRPVKALLVDGDPGETLFLSESYYLSRALAPEGKETSGISVRTVTVQKLEEMDMRAYDCIILANVGKLRSDTGERLRKAVENGSGLFVALGSRSGVTGRGAAPVDFLPVVLESIRKGSEGSLPLSLSPSLSGHRIPGVLGARWRLSLSDVKVHSFWRLGKIGKAISVLDLSNGLPAWMEFRMGKGSVILSTIPLDRDWSDFCIHPTFVPIVQQAVRYLGRAAAASNVPEAHPGEPLRFTIPDEFLSSGIQMRRPDGGLMSIQRNGIKSNEMAFAQTDTPGIYSLQDSAGVTIRVGVVNVDRRESEMSVTPPEDIAQLITPSAGSGRSALPGSAERPRRGFWTELLWLSVILLAVESYYARK